MNRKTERGAQQIRNCRSARVALCAHPAGLEDRRTDGWIDRQTDHTHKTTTNVYKGLGVTANGNVTYPLSEITDSITISTEVLTC
jgi:hypothetical protein